MSWLVVAIVVTVVANWFVMRRLIRSERFGAFREQETIAALRKSADTQEQCTAVLWKLHQAIELNKITHQLELARVKLEAAQLNYEEKKRA